MTGRVAHGRPFILEITASRYQQGGRGWSKGDCVAPPRLANYPRRRLAPGPGRIRISFIVRFATSVRLVITTLTARFDPLSMTFAAAPALGKSQRSLHCERASIAG